MNMSIYQYCPELVRTTCQIRNSCSPTKLIGLICNLLNITLLTKPYVGLSLFLQLKLGIVISSPSLFGNGLVQPW